MISCFPWCKNPISEGHCNSCALRRGRERQKKIVFSWYGGKCVCCGSTETSFLTLDHVKDDPIKRVKYTSYRIFGGTSGKGPVCAQGNLGGMKMSEYKLNATGHHLYRYLFSLGESAIPDSLQLLCFNCQWGKRLNGGFCPHHPKIDLRIVRL